VINDSTGLLDEFDCRPRPTGSNENVYQVANLFYGPLAIVTTRTPERSAREHIRAEIRMPLLHRQDQAVGGLVVAQRTVDRQGFSEPFRIDRRSKRRPRSPCTNPEQRPTGGRVLLP